MSQLKAQTRFGLLPLGTHHLGNYHLSSHH